MKKVFLLLTLLLFPIVANAADVVPSQNNKFGIHLTQPGQEDLKRASDLVNSNGGRWGYVTVVIQENDRDTKKWKELFEKMREYRLIPIVRLATNPEGANWRRANPEDAESWAEFLNNLPWDTENRYITLFNETNHATEWGGAVDPEGYAKIAKVFAEKLKEKNSKFVVMLAGFDASAPSSSPRYEDEGVYLRRVIATIGTEDFNKLFSALSSHSYPNPAFAGSPYGNGKGTVRTYEWELDLLHSLGVKDLPVFITETGWDASQMSRSQVASNFKIVYESVWGADSRVAAVTPFVLNYPADPFINFSWMGEGEHIFPQYYAVQAMEKTAGLPPVREEGSIEVHIPQHLVKQSTYHFAVTLTNSGDALWYKDEYHLAINNTPIAAASFSDIPRIIPGASGAADMIIETNEVLDSDTMTVTLYRGEKPVISTSESKIAIVPYPQLELNMSFYPKLRADADDVELQIFNAKEQLVYKEKHLHITSGKGGLEEVKNVALDEKYRIVVLRPGFLPRQKYVTFKPGVNQAGFTIMLPLDFNEDGAFNLLDIGSLIVDLRKLGRLIPSVK